MNIGVSVGHFVRTFKSLMATDNLRAEELREAIGRKSFLTRQAAEVWGVVPGTARAWLDGLRDAGLVRRFCSRRKLWIVL